VPAADTFKRLRISVFDGNRTLLRAMGRNADAVELLLAGLSHREIAERLSIAPETVKKHTYNAHPKLGVQNRVQLSSFVQNRLPRRG
jgi:DNA-binding CsgD family transcriptional regulator